MDVELLRSNQFNKAAHVARHMESRAVTRKGRRVKIEIIPLVEEERYRIRLYKMIENIKTIVAETLKLDSETLSYVEEAVLSYDIMIDEKVVAKIRDVKCECRGDSCVATMSLTMPEAVALALRLIEAAATHRLQTNSTK